MFRLLQKKDPSFDMARRYLAEHYPEFNNIYALRTSRKPSGDLFDASINRYTWSITLNLDPKFEERFLDIMNRTGRTVARPLETLVGGVVEHEVGHWNQCPKDIVYGEMILSSVSRGLKKYGMAEQDIVAATPYVANMFCDVVTNCLTGSKSFGIGRGLVYTVRAHAVSADNPSLEDYYVLFVDCQMKFRDPANPFRDIGRKYNSNYLNLEATSKRLLASVTSGAIADKAFGAELTDNDRKTAEAMLSKERNWSNASADFAEIIAPHILNKQQSMEENIKLMPIFRMFLRDERFRGRVLEQGLERENGKHALEESSNAGSTLSYINNTEVFDLVYRQAAGKIVLDFVGCGAEIAKPKFDLFHMENERIDESYSLPRNIAWDRTIIVGRNGREQMQLFKKASPYEINLEVDGPKGGSMDDLLFVVDTSGSMGWDMKPFDNSKYDMCLRTFYSVDKYLEMSRKSAEINYGLIQFGATGRTSWSGWQSCMQREMLRKQMFTGYQHAGETVLDGDKIDAALRTRKNFLAMVITDGQFSNEDSAIRSLMKIMRANNSMVLFELVNESGLKGYVEREGGTVIHLNRPDDLVGVNLQIVSQKYKNMRR